MELRHSSVKRLLPRTVRLSGSRTPQFWPCSSPHDSSPSICPDRAGRSIRKSVELMNRSSRRGVANSKTRRKAAGLMIPGGVVCIDSTNAHSADYAPRSGKLNSSYSCSTGCSLTLDPSHPHSHPSPQRFPQYGAQPVARHPYTSSPMLRMRSSALLDWTTPGRMQ